MYLRRSSISPKSLAPPTRSMPRKLIRLRRSRNWVAQISHFAWPFHQKHLNRPSDLFVVVEPPCSSGFPLNVGVDARHRATTVQRRKKLRTKCRIRFQADAAANRKPANTEAAVAVEGSTLPGDIGERLVVQNREGGERVFSALLFQSFQLQNRSKLAGSLITVTGLS